MKGSKILVSLLSWVCLLTYASHGFGQNYPSKPIKLIIPFAAGGANDLVGRALQKSLAKELKRTIIVENIPGGNTKLATLELLKSEPDGYILMLAGHAALMGYYYSGTYDSKVWEKMTIVGQSGEVPAGLVEVKVDSPFLSWAQLVDYAQKNPGKLSCGGPGAGGLMNLIVQETAKAAGIEVKYVPFAGAGPSGTALLGGHIDYRICVVTEAINNIRSGKTKGLAISYHKRLAELPDVPTFKELGLMEISYLLTFDIYGPPNLPQNITNVLARALEKAVKDPDYIQFCQKIAYQPIFKDAGSIRSSMKFFDENIGPKLAAYYKK
ncbi:MAG: tripartite tricarboxylate transporter substrate binding protein [Thermodesulfobacteriota bacterium]|jgi:tripartite-type tricarboxylate transporter receptor subunit TctC